MNVVTRVRDFFGTAPEPKQPQEPETRSTGLYRCEPCDSTYVSEELEYCSQCESPVEQVPTEHDIGLA